MRLVITRETDNSTLEIVDQASGAYVIHPDTVIAQSPELDFSGYEFSGSEGGYSVASRYQRRPFDLAMNVMEHWSSPKGLFELAAEARAFFDAHHDDLSVIHYTIDFYSCDKQHSVFQMRHGAITSPFGIRSEINEKVAQGQVSFIFADPYLYWSGDSGVGITVFRLLPRDATANVIYGRFWGEDGAVWQEETLKTWVFPEDSVIPGAPVTVDVVSEATVSVHLEFSGLLIDPAVTNATNGSSFRYVGTISDGSTLVVSTDGIILLDGGTPAGTWAGQLTARGGKNIFVLDADQGSSGVANVRIRGAL